MNRKALLMALRGAAREAGIAGGTGVAAGGATYAGSKAAGASDRDALRNAVGVGALAAGGRAAAREVSGTRKAAANLDYSRAYSRVFKMKTGGGARRSSVVDREFDPRRALREIDEEIAALKAMEPADFSEAAAKNRKMQSLLASRRNLGQRGG
jgi:hypothetical protein